MTDRIDDLRRISRAQLHGSRRKRHLIEIDRILAEYEQGRAASSCMAEIKKVRAS